MLWPVRGPGSGDRVPVTPDVCAHSVLQRGRSGFALMLWRWGKRARGERMVVPIDYVAPILSRLVLAAEDERSLQPSLPNKKRHD